MGFHRWERHDAIFPQARLSAQNALKIDSALAEAHEALGWVAWLYELKWDDAESHFKRAIEIDRNSAHARQAYALSLTARGRFDEAIAQFQRAAELDSDVAGFNDQAVILYCARRFDEAARAAQLTLEMKPDYAPARVMLGMCAEAQGQYAEAIPHLERAAGMAGRESNVLGRLAYAYARSGRRAEARKLVHEMAAKPSTFQIHLAHAYAGLDDRVRLFEALEKAREQSETELLFCAVEPLFDGLHGDSRFKALLVKLGLR
jgi:tetratricopeptide (TPR) repeat protein